MARIFVVDDSPMMRAHLRALLEQRPEWVVVGEAENGRRALEMCPKQKPDITVMDFMMPEMDGLEAARQLTKRQPNVPILMVTIDPSRQLEEEAQKAGVKGFCIKSHAQGVVKAVEALLRGETHFTSEQRAA